MIPLDSNGNYMPMLRCGIETIGQDDYRSDLKAISRGELHFGNCDNRNTRHTHVAQTTYKCNECGANRKWGN